jgi:formylmethanofuran dehydrogenase subunit E
MALEVLRELHRRKLTGEGTMALEALKARMASYRFDEHLETVATERFERPSALHPDIPEAEAASPRRKEVLARAAVAEAMRCPKCVEGRSYVLKFPNGDKTVCASCDYGWAME